MSKTETLTVKDERRYRWIFEKFKGNKAIYAFCPYCGFWYNPSYPDENFEPVITSVYKYCPMCAEFLYVSPEKIVIDKKDERYISELYK